MFIALCYNGKYDQRKKLCVKAYMRKNDVQNSVRRSMVFRVSIHVFQFSIVVITNPGLISFITVAYLMKKNHF